MDHAYVVMSGEHPYGTYSDLAAAQQATVDSHTRYLPDGYETEWQEEPGVDGTRVWQLRTRTAGRRWSKAYRSVIEVPHHGR